MSEPTAARRIILGITGASGARYPLRLIECLCGARIYVHLIVTPNGRRLLGEEAGIDDIKHFAHKRPQADYVSIHAYDDIGDVLASGSFSTSGMIICPCSSNTLGALAAGLAGNLLERAAAVTLKESRRLLIVPREMPASRIDLLNALRLNEAGAIICPASPGFYMQPHSIDDLVDFVVGKLLDLMNVPHELHTRWADQAADGRPAEPADKT